MARFKYEVIKKRDGSGVDVPLKFLQMSGRLVGARGEGVCEGECREEFDAGSWFRDEVGF